MKMLHALPAALALLLSACSPGSSGNSATSTEAAATSQAGLPVVPLIVESKGRKLRFDVEVAMTEQQQEQGLMFRKELAPDKGMIFPMNPPRTASFWMKDTLIPLDIIFIRTDGSIALVAADRQPYVREPVSAGIPVSGVLELPGGRAAELGIMEGDVVHWGKCAAQVVPDAQWNGLDFCPPEPAVAN